MDQNVKIVRNKFDFSKIKEYLSVLWSNAKCKEFGRTKKWYVAVIVSLLSICLSCIPILVHTFQVQGGSFLTQTLYGFDDAYVDFLNDMKENDYDFRFDETNYTCKIQNKTLSPDNEYLVYEHKSNQDPNLGVSEYVDFQVYYAPENVSFYDQYIKVNTLKTNQAETRDASYMLIGYDSLCIYIYKYGNTTVKSGAFGDYKNLNGVKSLSELIKYDSTNNISKNESINALKLFVDNAYETNKGQLALTQTGLNLASNVGVTLLMGLMLFILTRSKKNPNRDYKFQELFNMTYWSTTAPALLALVLGFMFSGYEIMLYVLLFGFRTMYFSMKQLSPVYQ